MSTTTTKARAGPDVPGVPIPAFFLFLAAFLVGVALELVFPSAWPPAGIRVVVALAAGAAWLALDVAAIVLFGAAGTSIWPMVPSTSLVTSGPYRLTRNPQYVGIACLHVAAAFALGVMWALVVLPVVLVIVDRLVIAREEPYLERRFGDPYREYKARVRRWL